MTQGRERLAGRRQRRENDGESPKTTHPNGSVAVAIGSSLSELSGTVANAAWTTPPDDDALSAAPKIDPDLAERLAERRLVQVGRLPCAARKGETGSGTSRRTVHDVSRHYGIPRRPLSLKPARTTPPTHAGPIGPAHHPRSVRLTCLLLTPVLRHCHSRAFDLFVVATPVCCSIRTSSRLKDAAQGAVSDQCFALLEDVAGITRAREAMMTRVMDPHGSKVSPEGFDEDHRHFYPHELYPNGEEF